MKTLLALSLLFFISVDAHRVRVLLQGDGTTVASSDIGSTSRRVRINPNKDGRFFNFADVPEGARGFLKSVEAANPRKLERIIANSNWRKGKEDLAKELNEDPDLGIDVESEALVFACTELALPENSALPAVAPVPSEASLPGDAATALATVRPRGSVRPRASVVIRASSADPTPDRAFQLSSRPSAARKIWLDFQGNTYTNTAWNKNGNSIIVPPYSVDGDPAFSTTERQNIIAIWRGVAEDFSPFDVDVTTVNQVNAGTSPANYMRVAVGGKSSSVLGISAGGVAFVGVYGRSDVTYQPAFVFSDDLGKGYPKSVWEAASHEVGHTMGLSHDGRTVSGGSEGYYQGTNGWAPIMGASYYQPVSQWSKGDYPNANNKEDDLAIIASKLPLVSDGNGNTIATATPLKPSISNGVATASAHGIISRTNRPAFFKLTATRAGTLTVNVAVVAPWVSVNRSNLNLLVIIYNSNNAAMARYNNPNGLDISKSFNLPAAGTYYISVRGAGEGAVATGGYSSYASLGQFSLVASYPA